MQENYNKIEVTQKKFLAEFKQVKSVLSEKNPEIENKLKQHLEKGLFLTKKFSEFNLKSLETRESLKNKFSNMCQILEHRSLHAQLELVAYEVENILVPLLYTLRNAFFKNAEFFSKNKGCYLPTEANYRHLNEFISNQEKFEEWGLFKGNFFDYVKNKKEFLEPCLQNLEKNVQQDQKEIKYFKKLPSNIDQEVEKFIPVYMRNRNIIYRQDWPEQPIDILKQLYFY